MPKSVTFKMDKAGIAEVLKSEGMRAMVDEAAEKIAAHAQSSVPANVQVGIQSYVTDRAAASVAIEDAAGMVYQAEHGTLTRAAKTIGADVTEK
jgi:hypothetical protein